MLASLALPDDLPESARRTYRRHLVAESLRMFSNGITALSGGVLRRSLHASDDQVTLFMTMVSVSFLMAGWWGPMMEGRRKKPFFLLAAVMTKLWLVMLVFSSDASWFLIVFGVAFLVESCFIIAQTGMFQSNYPAEARARLVARAGVLGRVASLGGAIAGGFLLDRFLDHGMWVLAAGGVLGFAAIVLYALIPMPEPEPAQDTMGGRRTPWHGIRRSARIFKANPAFARFEMNFFCYGLGFLALLPVQVFVLIDRFELDYKTYSMYQLVLVTTGILIVLPFAGALMDRKGPYGTSSVAFLCLMFFPIGMAAALWLDSLLVLAAAYLTFGLAMGFVDVAWNLSAITFARGKDHAAFMGAHVLLVGVRGVFAPWVGTTLYTETGPYGALGWSAGWLLVAGLLMAFSPDRAKLLAPEEAGA